MPDLRSRVRLRSGLPLLALGLPSRASIERRSFQEWLLDMFDVHGTIGMGTTSRVQHATRRSDGREVALKTMMSSDPEMIDFARKEVDVLRCVQHPHIIQAVDFLTFNGIAVSVLEFFDGLTLTELLTGKHSHRLSESTACRLTRALLSAVDHLHHQDILHRDIKPENVLVAKDARDLRLIDLNTACCLSEADALTPTGTRVYAAPEVVLGSSPSADADVWGVGVCAYFMLSGHLPQHRGSCVSRPSKLVEAASLPVEFSRSAWERVSPQCIAVLQKCLALDSLERPAPRALLDMPWFQQPHHEHEGIPLGRARSIADALERCPLLPGLEPADPALGPTAQALPTPSTVLPSSCWSVAGSSEQLGLEDLLRSGGCVEIDQTLDPGAGQCERDPRRR